MENFIKRHKKKKKLHILFKWNQSSISPTRGLKLRQKNFMNYKAYKILKNFLFSMLPKKMPRNFFT